MSGEYSCAPGCLALGALTLSWMSCQSIAVIGACRESKGLAFVLAMQSMEGFAAAAMDNAGPKCERAKPTLVSSSILNFIYRAV